MDWHLLYFGHVSPQEVQIAIRDAEWQSLRLDMKGKSLEYKYRVLTDYLTQMRKHLGNDFEEMRKVEVRITNYVTALSRGGLIKPSDYR